MRLTNTQLIAICAEQSAKRAALLFDGVSIAVDYARGVELHEELSVSRPDYVSALAIHADERDPTGVVEISNRMLWQCSIAFAHPSLECVPVYSSLEQFNAEFRTKEHLGCQILMDNIPLADPSKLSWEQVTEVRKSQDLMKRFVDLRLWLRKLGDSADQSQFKDQFEQRMLAYQAALKTNGVKTVNGALSLFVDPAKVLTTSTIAAGLSMTTNPVVGALAAGLTITGNIAVKLTEHWIGRNQIRSDFAEIALLEDLARAVQR